MLRLAALAWLLVLAPLELATALARLVVDLAEAPGGLALTIVAARVLVVAAGLVLGRQMAQRAPATRSFARRWAVADLGTLAIALATSALPSSRMPGDAPVAWAAYALAALVVVAAAD